MLLANPTLILRSSWTCVHAALLWCSPSWATHKVRICIIRFIVYQSSYVDIGFVACVDQSQSKVFLPCFYLCESAAHVFTVVRGTRNDSGIHSETGMQTLADRPRPFTSPATSGKVFFRTERKLSQRQSCLSMTRRMGMRRALLTSGCAKSSHTLIPSIHPYFCQWCQI